MKKIIYLFVFFCVNLSFGQDFTAVVKSYLKEHKTKFSLNQGDISDISISSQSFSNSLQAYNVYVDQNYQGIKVYNSVSPFVIKDGGVLNAQLSFVNNLSARTNINTPSISALSAISRAANGLGIDSPKDLTLLETREHNAYLFSDGGISLENIPVQLVYQKINEGEGLKLAWDLGIYVLDASHYYSVRVDALTGEILATDDWVVSCNFGDGDHAHNTTGSILFSNHVNQAISIGEVALATPSYRVFHYSLTGPHEGVDQLLADPSNSLASPYGWHDTDGVAGEEYTTTRGNNVIAWEDHDGNNGVGAMPDAGPTLQFDYPFNLPEDPFNYTDGAITNLFYMNNIMHDIFYQYGFDEASGNFQANNYGRGGSANDPVIADAQDGDRTNNANFLAGQDGTPGRMQMYLWSPPGLVMPSFLTVNNGPLSGSYYTAVSRFTPPVPDTPITADLALVEDDNSGSTNDPYDGCDVLLNPANLIGKIAVLRKGNCNYAVKVQNVQAAGAIAVIVVNDEPGDPTRMVASGIGINIPAVMIYKLDGEALIASLEAGDIINATLVDDGSGIDMNKRDGDLDNSIVAHEYGHGISNRLTGGRMSPGCLKNDEQMGEGWSDYFALMISMKPTDTGDKPRGIGTYAQGEGRGGRGMRDKHYTNDFSKNNFTYNSIKTQAIPHGVGSVWATMLWDMTWDFIDEYGYDPDIYNGQGGNNMALQLVMDGLKLQRCSPGFIDGRDAILQADQIANGGANKCLIWNAFAKRGLGLSASQGSTSSVMDGTEAFDVPTECNLGVGNNTEVKNSFIIYPNPTNGKLNVQSRFDVGRANISIFDVNGRKVFHKEIEMTYTGNIDVSNLNPGIYIIQVEGGEYAQTSKLIIN